MLQQFYKRILKDEEFYNSVQLIVKLHRELDKLPEKEKYSLKNKLLISMRNLQTQNGFLSNKDIRNWKNLPNKWKIKDAIMKWKSLPKKMVETYFDLFGSSYDVCKDKIIWKFISGFDTVWIVNEEFKHKDHIDFVYSTKTIKGLNKSHVCIVVQATESIFFDLLKEEITIWCDSLEKNKASLSFVQDVVSGRHNINKSNARKIYEKRMSNVKLSEKLIEKIDLKSIMSPNIKSIIRKWKNVSVKWKIKDTIRNWLSLPKKMVKTYFDNFGSPYDICKDEITWKFVAGFDKMWVVNEEVGHEHPVGHIDFVYSTIKVKNLTKKHVCIIVHATGSIFFNLRKGEATARCHYLVKNAVSLSFVEDVVSGKHNITIQNSREIYGKRILSNQYHSWFNDPLNERIRTLGEGKHHILLE